MFSISRNNIPTIQQFRFMRQHKCLENFILSKRIIDTRMKQIGRIIAAISFVLKNLRCIPNFIILYLQ